MNATTMPSPQESLAMLLRVLKLPTIAPIQKFAEPANALIAFQSSTCGGPSWFMVTTARRLSENIQLPG